MRYYCSTYIKPKQCNKYYIRGKEIDDVVLKSLNTYIGLVYDAKEKIDDAVSYSNVEYSEETKKQIS